MRSYAAGNRPGPVVKLLLVLFVLLGGCGPRMGKMPKYEWLASNSAPKGCPMRLVVGGFLLTGGGELYIPSKTLHSGWGTSVSIHVVGEKFKPLPERVTITFYSFLEDKFFAGTFDLPRARIAERFAAGYRTVREKSGRGNFDEIVAGVAPGGTLAVWLVGIGRQEEVFFGKAPEVELDWHDAIRIGEEYDRKAIVEQVLAETAGTDPLVPLRRQHLDLNVWSTYRERYDVHPVIEGFDVPTSIELQYFNGEQEDLFLPEDEDSKRAKRTVPRFINIFMRSLGKQVDLTFDEEEALSTFKRLGTGGVPLEMVFRRDFQDGRPMFGVHLRNAHESVELNKIKMEFFDL